MGRREIEASEWEKNFLLPIFIPEGNLIEV